MRLESTPVRMGKEQKQRKKSGETDPRADLYSLIESSAGSIVFQKCPELG